MQAALRLIPVTFRRKSQSRPKTDPVSVSRLKKRNFGPFRLTQCRYQVVHGLISHRMPPIGRNIAERIKHEIALMHTRMRQDQHLRRPLPLLGQGKIAPVPISLRVWQNPATGIHNIQINRPGSPSDMARAAKITLYIVQSCQQVRRGQIRLNVNDPVDKIWPNSLGISRRLIPVADLHLPKRQLTQPIQWVAKRVNAWYGPTGRVTA